MHSWKMKRLVLVLLSSISLGFAMPASSQTTYLVIKSDEQSAGVYIHSIPMLSIDQCEEAGAVIIGSSRFDTKHSKEDGFECIQGK